MSGQSPPQERATTAVADRAIDRRDRIMLVLALCALATLFIVWFRHDLFPLLAYAIFALPPLLLAGFVSFGSRLARFWSGVLALAWFSHGVMIAWSVPVNRIFALTEIALAIAIVIASSAGGMRARARKRKAAREISA